MNVAPSVQCVHCTMDAILSYVALTVRTNWEPTCKEECDRRERALVNCKGRRDLKSQVQGARIGAAVGAVLLCAGRGWDVRCQRMTMRLVVSHLIWILEHNAATGAAFG